MKESTASSSILPALLGVAFIVLKLCHVIDWSWWWVLAPFWVTFALVSLVTVVVLAFVARK
jgi:phosphoglycerol transferase MdoB-like AlkP superfamily enzyme